MCLTALMNKIYPIFQEKTVFAFKAFRRCEDGRLMGGIMEDFFYEPNIQYDEKDCRPIDDNVDELLCDLTTETYPTGFHAYHFIDQVVKEFGDKKEIWEVKLEEICAIGFQNCGGGFFGRCYVGKKMTLIRKLETRLG